MVSIGRSNASWAAIRAPSPLHDHQRSIDAALFEVAAGGINQPRHHGDQPGVEQSGQGPARASKPGRKVVAAGDRQGGAGANHVPCCDFMSRIAHREISGDRHCRDLIRQRGQPLFQQGQIERGFASVDIMSTRKLDHRIIAQCICKTITSQHLLAKNQSSPARHAHSDLPPVHWLQVWWTMTPARCAWPLRVKSESTGFNCAGNANSKIMAGRQRLGGCENAFAFAVEHGIGIGAASIYPEKKW
jgi:hypothetical protein